MADILIKGMEMPKGNNVLIVDSAGTITILNRWTGKTEATDPSSVLAIELLHCKDCDSFIEETNICTSFGSWTQADGYCHKAERRK